MIEFYYNKIIRIIISLIWYRKRIIQIIYINNLTKGMLNTDKTIMMKLKNKKTINKKRKLMN